MNFLGIGPIELLLVGLVAFIFLGPARMVEVARSLGKMVQEVRRTTNDLPNMLSLDEPLDQPPRYEPGDRDQEPESDTREGESDGR